MVAPKLGSEDIALFLAEQPTVLGRYDSTVYTGLRDSQPISS